MESKPIHCVLPLDVVYEIFARLSVKTLINLQCVSKTFHSLITNPQFQQHYYSRRSQQGPLLLLTGKGYHWKNHSISHSIIFSTYNNINESPIKTFSKWVPPPRSDILLQSYATPIQSCEGLVCICDIREEHIFVCNPSTEEIIALPMPKCAVIGFGYVTSTKEFKVVMFHQDFGSYDPITYTCKVFTLGTSEWRTSRPAPQYKRGFASTAPFIHGFIHLLRSPEEYYGDGLIDGIDAFNIDTEEYTKIPFPKFTFTPEDAPLTMSMEVLRGSLSLILQFENSYDIWLLNDYNSEKWVKEYSFDVTSFGFCYASPRVILGDGSILMTIHFENDDQLLYRYSPHDKTFNRIDKSCSAIFYFESFLSLKHLCTNTKSTREISRNY